MPQSYTPFRRYPPNDRGRDFVVGDIHGEFSQLEEQLGRRGFDGARDRLFSVGDLVDRGLENRRALEFLAHPWFHAVRGNHDQWLLDYPADAELWFANGGAWWEQLGERERQQFRERFALLPYLMEVPAAGARVGIVHADPVLASWPQLIRRLEAGEEYLSRALLWSRARMGSAEALGAVAGIDLVVCGHNVQPEGRPRLVDNVLGIDTGAVFGGPLTLLELPEALEIAAG